MRKIPFLIFAFILFLALAIQAAPSCSYCGKTIDGRYVKFEDGSIYCIDCIQTKIKCSFCNKPSKSTITIDDKPICRQCLTRLEHCSFCDKPLVGKYESFPDLKLNICLKCSQAVSRCDFCGKPDNKLIRADKRRICRSCYNQSDFCHTCRTPIEGEYLWFDGDESKKYCQRCVNHYTKCASCGAPSGGNSQRLEDHRVLCQDCYRAGYFDPGQIGLIKRKILAFLDSYFGMNLKHKIRYSLQGQDFIKNKSDAIGGDLNGLFYRENDKFEIYVLYGLREKDLYQVISHEIAHAWASENCRANLTLEEAEGFAQWVAYYSLIQFGYSNFGETLVDGDNVYARGLRMMLEIEKNGGHKAIFRSLAK
ncbi:MAG: hypothetical protein GY839_15505 [candidate division Zixibacteria bacterium]|nr:hypothetical protein [candidate division Zixibacteria bacterium]